MVETRISKEFSADQALLQKALDDSSAYVRSDVQLNLWNPKAKGRILTAAEVAFSFGPNALRDLQETGVYVI